MGHLNPVLEENKRNSLRDRQIDRDREKDRYCTSAMGLYWATH